MDPNNDQTAPYGTWPSPISAEMVARSGIEFGHLAPDGQVLYWREERPEEDGRGVIVRGMDDSTDDLTPQGYDVRTLVHEYGGGDFAAHDGQLYFANFEDQRVYRQVPGESPVAITPEPETDRGLRFADFEITDDGRYLYCVRENHDAAAEEGLDEPVNELVRLAAEGEDSTKVVATGHDFYASPRLSPADERLAWLTWDHPRMPWDGTELHVADVESDGTLTNSETVMGGPEESVFSRRGGTTGRSTPCPTAQAGGTSIDEKTASGGFTGRSRLNTGFRNGSLDTVPMGSLMTTPSSRW